MSLHPLATKAHALRTLLVETLWKAKSGHPGGSLSIIEMLTLLYFKHLRHDPQNPQWATRDRFILSKGHASPALYCALAENGYFSKDLLATLDQDGGKLPKHAARHKLAGIEASTGDLGQGICMATGMALAAKMDQAAWRVFCIVSDGECNEGTLWEATMSAKKYRLDNLMVLVDWNKMTLDDTWEEVMPIDLEAFWRGTGWEVRVCDGHDLNALDAAITELLPLTGRPKVIVCHTTKGKGISFMENVVAWHSGVLTDELAQKALAELKAAQP